MTIQRFLLFLTLAIGSGERRDLLYQGERPGPTTRTAST